MPKKLSNIKQGCYLYSQDEKFSLVSGADLNNLDLAYETYGVLNSQKDNVILLHHSLSMSAHASSFYSNSQNGNDNNEFDYNHRSQAGWWDCMIGPGKVLDTDKYYIICINNLGSCFGSTGPSNYHAQFPTITIHDMVISQKLLLDYLGISKLKLIIGSSMGGMLSLAWLQLYPDTVENLFVAACAHKAYPINIFNRMIQQEIIHLNQVDKSEGMKIARMLGYYNYRSSQELNSRFDNNNFAISSDYINQPVYKNSELYSYFSHNGIKFAENFHAESYLCLLNAMDLFDLTVSKSYHQAGYTAGDKNTNIIIVGINSDILFPIFQQQESNDLLVKYGYRPEFIEHKSNLGHDAFLIEHEAFGEYIRKALFSKQRIASFRN